MQNYKYLRTTALGLVMMLSGLGASQAYAQDSGNAVRDEIIVTATKRNERLIDVPISMSVVDAEMIEQTGVRELKGISDYIPNVEISQTNDYGSTVTIRGVGANSRNIGFDTRVGVYVDGIYMGQSPALNQELLDLQQVEVLRGPQGTLFGKDTVAGAVNLITKKPSDKFEGKISGDIGNLGYTEFKGIVNIPLSDTVAVKAALSKSDRNGYIPNTGTGNKLASVDKIAYRAQVRFTPNDAFEANISFDGLNAEALLLNGENVTDILGLQPVPQDREVNFSFDPNENRDVYGAAATLEYKTDSGFIIKSMTGWRDTHAFFNNATDYSPTDIVSIEYTDDYSQLSQEFQLISPDDSSLTYVAGIYLYRQDSDTNRDVVFGDRFFEDFLAPLVGAPGAPDAAIAPIAAFLGFGPEGSKVTNSGNVVTKNYAAYFNGSYDLSERLTLGLGARYSVVDKDVNWTLDGRNSGFFGIGSTNVPIGGTSAPTPLISDRSDTSFTPAASLTYAITDQTNVYVKYGSGFKSGGFNIDFINANEINANPNLKFDKETVDTYELGIKGSTGRLNFSADVFLSKFHDYQVNQFIVLDPNASPPLTSIRITNAASVESKGFELEASFQATDNLLFQGSLGLLDATFDKFPGGATGGGDASGNKLPGAPDLSASFGAQYYQSLPAMSAELLFRLDVTHRSGVFQTIDNTKTGTIGAIPGTIPFGYVKPLTLVNARVGFLPNNEKFQLYLWSRNLMDQTQITSDFQDFFGTKVRYPSIGRTFGLEGVWNF
jgi:iron complex outermembrane receptor protein